MFSNAGNNCLWEVISFWFICITLLHMTFLRIFYFLFFCTVSKSVLFPITFIQLYYGERKQKEISAYNNSQLHNYIISTVCVYELIFTCLTFNALGTDVCLLNNYKYIWQVIGCNFIFSMMAEAPWITVRGAVCRSHDVNPHRNVFYMRLTVVPIDQWLSLMYI